MQFISCATGVLLGSLVSMCVYFLPLLCVVVEGAVRHVLTALGATIKAFFEFPG